jgi:hypothetical protein
MPREKASPSLDGSHRRGDAMGAAVGRPYGAHWWFIAASPFEGRKIVDICKNLKILLACDRSPVLYVSTFDEDLLKHISHELADDAGRASDTS